MNRFKNDPNLPKNIASFSVIDKHIQPSSSQRKGRRVVSQSLDNGTS